MSDFIPFQKIPRLKRGCVITEKIDGTNAGSVELADAVYGIEPNIPVIHQVVVCQDACMRQGTHATKNRHDVSGGGKKPYRQKGTGRARQGSTRAPSGHTAAWCSRPSPATTPSRSTAR